MEQPSLNLPMMPVSRRRGRPPGARNRSSLDLARYVEAQFGGMTPGQQAANLCLVSPRDLKTAKARAADLQARALLGAHLPSDLMQLAMVVKAAELALALGCDKRDAWLLLQKEREGLMPYIHQRQAPAAPKDQAAPATVFIVPDGPDGGSSPAQLVDDDDIEFVDDLPSAGEQVGHLKSDGDT
jgi:hypothetical protein